MRKTLDRIGRFFYRLKGMLLSSDSWVFVWKTVGLFQTKSQTLIQTAGRIRFFRDSAVFSRRIGKQLLLNTACVTAFVRKAGGFVSNKTRTLVQSAKTVRFASNVRRFLPKLRDAFVAKRFFPRLRDAFVAKRYFPRLRDAFVAKRFFPRLRDAFVAKRFFPRLRDAFSAKRFSPKFWDANSNVRRISDEVSRTLAQNDSAPVAKRRYFPRFRDSLVANRRVIFRTASVAFLSYAFLSMSFQPNADQKTERLPVLQTAEIGMGGGDFGAGKTVDEGLPESLQTGVLEPEFLSKPRTLLYSSYKVKQGDIIGDLAAGFGLNQDTLISLNNIKNARLLQIGQTLRVPNQDGIMYTVKRGDTVDTIAEKYKSSSEALKFANELFLDTVPVGTALFIPGAKMDWMERQEIYGDLFMWPVGGYITSNYGYRSSPFGGGRQFHSGLDIGAPMGTPVRAAMSGRVSSVSYDAVLGNYIVVTHHSGYRTMYGHLSVARVKTGAYVGTGERIGDVGMTGQTTGPHVHFTVYKNGVTVNPRTLMR